MWIVRMMNFWPLFITLRDTNESGPSINSANKSPFQTAELTKYVIYVVLGSDAMIFWNFTFIGILHKIFGGSDTVHHPLFMMF